ncbi:inosine triphosphate pyrophosphatase [Patella vulgata]|uniref:inosine triphosphate pyrophosphatase n=1 Tax=Patella vulgata TaxID=6465 RepID=UPI00217F8043|nr:inosine triphosphate pyrophosphatase [Patella vulgata]XP_050400739.1 inosine triphosphate pyrophosphatase [Patella vulgata]
MLRMAKPLVLVTGNIKKLEEFKQILGSTFPYEILSKDIDLPEYQGEPIEVAEAKCHQAIEHIKGPVIVEDTSLCFNALGGLPGPYIKWFLKNLGPSGLYKLLSGFDDKTAYALCTYAYSSGEEGVPIKIFSGRCDGSIVEPRGPANFGWDPCFMPQGFDKTYAEMDKSAKHSISHRGKAMAMLKDYFVKNGVPKI